jgi:hypothetical protein
MEVDDYGMMIDETPDKLSQNEIVKKRLMAYGEITRNYCLSLYPAITRLTSRINDLKKQGMKIKKGAWRGKDYVYELEGREKMYNSPEEKFQFAEDLQAEIEKPAPDRAELEEAHSFTLINKGV